MQCAIDDLQLKFDVVHNAMVGSGWAFQNVTDIRINMAKVEHRLVERTKKNWQIVKKNFRFYPKGWRGKESIINFNYKNNKFWKRVDVCTDWMKNRNSPCVMYCLKIHKMIHNDKLRKKKKRL